MESLYPFMWTVTIKNIMRPPWAFGPTWHGILRRFWAWQRFAGLLFRLDTRQLFTGRCIVRVLWHQLAGKGFFQDGLTQGFGFR